MLGVVNEQQDQYGRNRKGGEGKCDRRQIKEASQSRTQQDLVSCLKFILMVMGMGRLWGNLKQQRV